LRDLNILTLPCMYIIKIPCYFKENKENGSMMQKFVITIHGKKFDSPWSYVSQKFLKIKCCEPEN